MELLTDISFALLLRHYSLTPSGRHGSLPTNTVDAL